MLTERITGNEYHTLRCGRVCEENRIHTNVHNRVCGQGKSEYTGI